MRRILLSIGIFFGIIFSGLPCFAVTFNGFVADEAHILQPEMVEKINKQAQELQTRTGADVAVVTITKKDLKNRQLSDVTLKIGRDHKIGSKDKNEGVVFAVVPQGNPQYIDNNDWLNNKANEGCFFRNLCI